MTTKSIIIGLLLVGLLLACGCTPVTYDYPPPELPEDAPPGSIPIPEEPASSQEGTVILPDEPPIDRTWISPGKVMVGNFYPGARAEWNLLVHNGKDTQASFVIAYRYPDHVGEGYVKPTTEVQDWVIIADPTPILMPKETREILIALEMPKDAISPGKLWEFWISVKDQTQTGMITTELCSRWCVSMR